MCVAQLKTPSDLKPGLALQRIDDYVETAGHGNDVDGPLFRPLKNPAGQGNIDRPLTHGASIIVF